MICNIFKSTTKDMKNTKYCKDWYEFGVSMMLDVNIRKKCTKNFYDKIGIVVDQPKQGDGNSNDGNTTSKFIENTWNVSIITVQ